METLTASYVNAIGTPAVEGLIFRPFRRDTDYPSYLEMLNAAYLEDKIDAVETIEGLRHEDNHLTNCDLNTDALVADIGGRVVGQARVSWWVNDVGERLYGIWGNVHPAWRGKGIGRALLHWQEQRARDIAAGHPNDHPRALQAWTMNSAVSRARLLKRAGYEPVRYGFMMARSLEEPIPDLPLPAGLDVRPVQPEHMRAIWDALDEAFRDHWGHRPGTEEDYQRFIGWPDQTPQLWQVAWAGDQVAGMVLNTIFERENIALNQKRGWTDPICVRRPWRKQGLARALIMRSLRLLEEQGMIEACLGVDTHNPNGALRLYETCGYRQINSSTTYRKPL